jgi:hypothetical protein
MHNVQLCMDVISANVPGFPTLDYCAEDIVSGTVSLWRLLDSLHEAVRHNMRFRRSGSRERGSTRSVSPAGGMCCSAVGFLRVIGLQTFPCSIASSATVIVLTFPDDWYRSARKDCSLHIGSTGGARGRGPRLLLK